MIKRLMFVFMLILLSLLVFSSVLFSKEVEVELFTWQWTEPQNQPYWEQFRDTFNAMYPGIKLKVTGVASGEYNAQLLIRIASGDAPDVFNIRPTQIVQLIELGALQNLDKWLEKMPWKDNLLAQELTIKDGSHYALSQTHTPQVLIYNKEILAKAGVKVPTNVEELVAAAEQIYKKTGVFGFGVCSDVTNILHMNIESRKWVYGFGGAWAVNGTPTANKPETIEGIRFYKKLYDADFTPKGRDLPSLDQMMWEEGLAMMIEGAWLLGAVKQNNPKILHKFDVVLPPTPTKASILGGAYFGMSAQSADKEAAWKILELYNTKEWQQKYVTMTAQIPAQAGMVPESLLKEEPWWAVFDEAAANYAAALGYIAQGFDLVAEEYNNEIGKTLAKILTGDPKDVEKILNELQETLVRKFKF